MPPPPGYNKNKLDQLGSLEIKDLDGLIEIHEMNGTLKPRPPPRVDKEWTAIGLSYPGMKCTFSLVFVYFNNTL